MIRTIGIVLFPRFELLDVFGPAEMFGRLSEHFRLVMIGESAGRIASNQGAAAHADVAFADCPPLDLLLVPGGMGTRDEVRNPVLVAFLKEQAARAEWVLSVCTGAALLACAGLLDGKRATTNKRAFEWVVTTGPEVQWVKQARWIEDGKFFTSAGVSAGMDMALAVIAKLCGSAVAEQAAVETEYDWHRDADWDPFAALY